MEKNDLEALRAAFLGVKSTAAKLQQMEGRIEALGRGPQPDDTLIRAASAHAIAAAAFSGLLHRLFAPGGTGPAPGTTELTDSAGESAS